MATVIETTLPPSSSPSSRKRRIKSEEAVNCLLIKHKGYEFIDGKLEKKEMPTAKHSGIATRLSAEIWFYLKKNKIGRVYSNNPIFQIGVNKSIPDVAFVSAEKIPPAGEPFDIWNFATDLAIEVISPTERHNQVERKISDYFRAGVRQVWKIVPELKTLTIYFSTTKTKILIAEDEITCEEILPGFRLKLSEIFID